jgi:hypothetical protein
MKRGWASLPLAVCVALCALASTASASTVFHPRVKNALGLIPPVNSQGNFNTEPSEGSVFTQVTYHGGQTMTGGITVHTIFWAPPGFAFQGAPTGSLSSEGMVEQFYNDVAAASTGTSGAAGACTPGTPNNCNVFTVEPQFGWGTTFGGVTPGQNTIHYNSAAATFSGE